jgi:hypothetical protein
MATASGTQESESIDSLKQRCTAAEAKAKKYESEAEDLRHELAELHRLIMICGTISKRKAEASLRKREIGCQTVAFRVNPYDDGHTEHHDAVPRGFSRDAARVPETAASLPSRPPQSAVQVRALSEERVRDDDDEANFSGDGGDDVEKVTEYPVEPARPLPNRAGPATSALATEAEELLRSINRLRERRAQVYSPP